MTRSYYAKPIVDFLVEDPSKIIGELSLNHEHSLEDQQKNAWVKQIEILKSSLKDHCTGKIYFEFSIPRMGKRVDNIVIINNLIFVLEFKVGEKAYPKHSIEQVVDYSLDLLNFHEGSHGKHLIPMLISTKAESTTNNLKFDNGFFTPVKANQNNLGDLIDDILAKNTGENLNIEQWESSLYKPTPTIIEAAQALYKGHSVHEISRNDAGAINLSRTTTCINHIIDNSKKLKQKSICFLTGVPGAGKTLAGLNIANDRMKTDEDEHAVFLSGNGPLVDVLREALTRDSVFNARENGDKTTKRTEWERSVKFIQNIHHFRDDNLRSSFAPIEKVVVFDEAQRAWTREQASSFMKRKKGDDEFDMSEPDFLISVMDRHEEWCTIVCLIGGGQEINVGEAGVSEWLSALQQKYNHWNVYYSNSILDDNNYLTDPQLRNWIQEQGQSMADLHLSVSVRSFRSEKVSEFVQHLLDLKNVEATNILDELQSKFPIYLTRSLKNAKDWLKNKSKGSERIGIVASSGGKRLRTIGIDVRNKIEAANWFLNNSEDVRSSNYLEEIATEFDIQGLEIDYVCLAWDINMFLDSGEWHYKRFEGTAWRNIHSAIEKKYMLNTYRVLMTRARQGLIILIPEGDHSDSTRSVSRYDSIYNYLLSCGLKEINGTIT